MLIAKNYTKLFKYAEKSTDIENAISVVLKFYKDERRLSGRYVVEHCFETAEYVAEFTSNPIYLISAIFHDVREDLNLSNKDVLDISGKYKEKIARNVAILSKNLYLRDREVRDNEYMNRLSIAIFNEDSWIGVVKLADRLSNLRDINYLPHRRKISIARQTIDFYIPIAISLNQATIAKNLAVLSLPHIDSYSKSEVALSDSWQVV